MYFFIFTKGKIQHVIKAEDIEQAHLVINKLLKRHVDINEYDLCVIHPDYLNDSVQEVN